MSRSLRRIHSRDNALLRELAALAQSSRERRRRGESFIEGVHLCSAYLDRYGAPRTAVVAESALADPEVAAIVERCIDATAVVDDVLYRSFSQLVQGTSVAFVVATPRAGLPARIETDCVYLDRIQDPGNVGSILRSCAAAGVALVVTAPRTAFVWSPKVLRAGMGAHFRLTICEQVGWDELRARLQTRLLGTRATGATALYASDLRSAACWLLGNEGQGLSVVDDRIEWLSIPQTDAVESLNVAAAAAVCLFEQRRQRLHVQSGATSPGRPDS